MNESTLTHLMPASQAVSYLWLIPFLPLFGFLVNGVTGRHLRNNQWVNGIALGSVGASFYYPYFISPNSFNYLNPREVSINHFGLGLTSEELRLQTSV